MDNKRNKFDRKDSLEIGERAENIFLSTALERGWKTTRASDESNIHEHWDCLIARDTEKFRVDIKSMKRLSRRDAAVQDKWVWIELHGVRKFDRGWMYNGKAELIAFEKEKSFLIVRRSDLIELVERLINMKLLVDSAIEAKYKVYGRPGRPDRLTMIEAAKLESIKWDEWSKFGCRRGETKLRENRA